MKNFVLRIVCLLVICELVVAEKGACIAAEPKGAVAERVIKDPVVISIRSSLQTDSRVIRLVDVANITGGDPALRERLKQLDIEDSLSPGESVTILPPQIEFRVRIAGIDMERVSLRGSEIRVTAREAGSAPEMGTTRETIRDKSAGPKAGAFTNGSKSPRPVDFSSISFDEGPLEREIIQAAKECLLSKLPWPVENVECRLLQPLAAEIHRAETTAGYEFSAELRSSGPPVGPVQIRVQAEGPKLPLIDVNVFLEVRHFDQIVLASKTIERGHPIVASDLYTDRQDVTELAEYCSNADELIGTKARKSIRALTPVRLADVEVKSRTDSEILIKRRDQVKMIARLGTLSVTALGEALQEGRMGETIRIRNVESNANIQGKVTGPGEVEIAF